VNDGYRIQEVSQRSGFSAATLRYYEGIGLVPPAGRTPAGYRVYDDTTLARLAFVARAKQLGCTLDEISELNTAWEGGECGPVQDRLSVLVDDKIQQARTKVAELLTLIADLQVAADNLRRHRPSGPCDDRCGCTTVSFRSSK
jgi:DNA-binding transcriptional MerR regulator